MLYGKLEQLYLATWGVASPDERNILSLASGLKGETSPAEIFAAIAKAAKSFGPLLVAHIWHELEAQRRITRIEIDAVQLSDKVSLAVQLALAYKMGTRIDRVIADLGGADNENMQQEDLERKAKAAGLQWQAVSYAITR
jgi:hypothetical protein